MGCHHTYVTIQIILWLSLSQLCGPSCGPSCSCMFFDGAEAKDPKRSCCPWRVRLTEAEWELIKICTGDAMEGKRSIERVASSDTFAWCQGTQVLAWCSTQGPYARTALFFADTSMLCRGQRAHGMQDAKRPTHEVAQLKCSASTPAAISAGRWSVWTSGQLRQNGPRLPWALHQSCPCRLLEFCL